jgi:hypothetical protein
VYLPADIINSKKNVYGLADSGNINDYNEFIYIRIFQYTISIKDVLKYVAEKRLFKAEYFQY